MSARILLSLVATVFWLTTPAHADTEFDYLLHCGGCHLEDGRGDPPAIPDLRTTLGVFSSFQDGRAYIAQVPGSSQAPLNDAELAAVLNWMLRTFTPRVQPRPFSAEEISGYRGTSMMNPLQVRAALLARFSSTP